MSGMIYYNSYDIFVNPEYHKQRDLIPGGREFEVMFKLFSHNITFLDRTNTVQVPLKTSLLPHMRLPDPVFTGTSFEEICDKRAREVLDHAAATNREIAVMYSGGVDSTLILCAFLKVARPEELKRIIVLLSDKSIHENPNFYNNFVSKTFRCDSSFKFPAYVGNDKILFLTGENADQLFGSQVIAGLSAFAGWDMLFKPLKETEDTLRGFFWSSVLDKYKDDAVAAFEVLKRICDNAPIPIDNAYKFFWWINFAMKWQSVYVRLMPYSWNKSTIKLEENYTTFFSPAEFQLWAMENADQLAGDDPSQSKIVAKRYILDVNGDKTYLRKPKIGSLSAIVQRKQVDFYIDDKIKYHSQFPGSDLINPNNDFVRK